MKKIIQLVLALTVISAVCAAVLAVVDRITRDRIANIASVRANEAALAVLPPGVKAVDDTRADPAHPDVKIYVGYADEARRQVLGFATFGASEKGYGGTIRLMVGLTAEGKVVTYRALVANETPGLGAKLADKTFSDQFAGKPAATLSVKKDGGAIEAITGATITSRAVCEALADAQRRVDRLSGRATAEPAAAKSADGDFLFDPASEKVARSMLPNTTVSVRKQTTTGRYPAFVGRDAKGQVTGYAVTGHGVGKGPAGTLDLFVLFAAKPQRTVAFNPAPRPANPPHAPDMEGAQRTAFNAAMQDAAAQLKALPAE